MWVRHMGTHLSSKDSRGRDGRVHAPSGRKQILLNINMNMADEMSQWIKVPATKPGDPGSTHMVMVTARTDADLPTLWRVHIHKYM